MNLGPISSESVVAVNRLIKEISEWENSGSIYKDDIIAQKWQAIKEFSTERAPQGNVWAEVESILVKWYASQAVFALQELQERFNITRK